ncbi:GTP-binding protein [Neisseria dentiae]|nr:GTP-binding protein [Neisseria dentiae]
MEDTADADIFRVSGRGELHLTILLENMRREGYELAVGKPRVVFREIDGQKCEPYENLTVDVPDDNQGAVMEELGRRAANSPIWKATATVAPASNTTFPPAA